MMALRNCTVAHLRGNTGLDPKIGKRENTTVADPGMIHVWFDFSQYIMHLIELLKLNRHVS